MHLDLLSNTIKNTAKEMPKYWRRRESSFLVRVKMALGCCCIAWKSWRSCRILEFYSCCQSCSDGAGAVGMDGSFCLKIFIIEVLIFCRSWFGITWSFDAWRIVCLLIFCCLNILLWLIVMLGAWIWKPWKLELAIQGGWEIDQHLTKGGCWNLILLLLDVVIFPDERES